MLDMNSFERQTRYVETMFLEQAGRRERALKILEELFEHLKGGTNYELRQPVLAALERLRPGKLDPSLLNRAPQRVIIDARR